MIVDQRISGARAGTRVDVFAGGGDAAVDVAGKDQLDLAEFLVLADDLALRLFPLSCARRDGLPSIVKSRSRMGMPETRSRTAPPVR